MSGILRDLAIKVGFDIDLSKLDGLDAKLNNAKLGANALDRELAQVSTRMKGLNTGQIGQAGPGRRAGPGQRGVNDFGKDFLRDVGQLRAAVGVVEQGMGAARQVMESTGEAALDFGRDIAQLQTILPGADARVAELRGQIQLLAQQTGTSSKQITASVNDVLQAFGDSPDVMAIATTAVKGAAAGGTDARTAFDLLSATMLAYEDKTASGAASTMDLAFSMRQFGKVEIAELAQRIGMVSGSAKFLGVTQKELFAIMGTSAGITGQTAQTFTQFSAVMAEMSSPKKGGALAKIYKKLGINSIKATVAQEGLIPVLKKIVDQTDGTSESLGRVFTNQEALRLILPITSTLYGRYGEAMKTAGAAQGSMVEAHKNVQGGFNRTGTEIDVIERKLDTMNQNFGTKTAPMMALWKEAWLGVATAALLAGEEMGTAITSSDGYLTGVWKSLQLGVEELAIGGAAAVVETFGNAEQERLAKKAFRIGSADIGERAFGFTDDNAAMKARVVEKRSSAEYFSKGKVQADALKIEHKGDIIVTVTGADAADPHKIAQAVRDKQNEALMRNVPNAATGDNP